MEVNEMSKSGIERPPNLYEQAREAARDDPGLTELGDILHDMPAVTEVLVDGRDEDWRPVEITVGFGDDGYRATDDVLAIMRSAGWKAEHVTFAPYNRIRFSEVKQ